MRTRDVNVENHKEALRVFKQGRSKKYKDDSLALHTDLYQINMAETYWEDGIHSRKAVFEAYFRKLPFDGSYAVFAGLERIVDYIAAFRLSGSDIDYLRNEVGYRDDFIDFLKTFRFNGDIRCVREGETVFPNEPLIEVKADLAQAQWVETPILNIINFHTLIATKAARMRCAAGNGEIYDTHDLMEFGTRRAHEFGAALYGARAAYIGGFNGTSNVRAGKLFGIPVKGTHAHSMVQVYGDEYEAFKKYARRHKNCVFLVDTYDTLNSGVPNAIKVAKELGDEINFVGIRLDSGDLAYLSRKARQMLDEAGFPDAKIFASNDLDEYEMQSLRLQGAKIDSWGIGTKLITAYDQPALGAVYKLAAIEDENGEMVSRIKLSEDAQKTSTPGVKNLFRIVDNVTKQLAGDYLAMDYEDPNNQEWLTVGLNGYRDFDAKQLQHKIFSEGKLIYIQPTIDEMRAYCLSNLKMLRDSYKNNREQEKYTVALSPDCYQNKVQKMHEARAKMVI